MVVWWVSGGVGDVVCTAIAVGIWGCWTAALISGDCLGSSHARRVLAMVVRSGVGSAC